MKAQRKLTRISDGEPFFQREVDLSLFCPKPCRSQGSTWPVPPLALTSLCLPPALPPSLGHIHIDLPVVPQHACHGLTSGPWHWLLPLLEGSSPGHPHGSFFYLLQVPAQMSPPSGATPNQYPCTFYNHLMEVMIYILISHCLGERQLHKGQHLNSVLY